MILWLIVAVALVGLIAKVVADRQAERRRRYERERRLRLLEELWKQSS
jgi:hypothetical protein